MLWKQDSTRFLGEKLIIEGVTAVTVFFDAADTRKYVIFSYLPLLVAREDKHHTEQSDAKEMAERRVREYFARMHKATKKD